MNLSLLTAALEEPALPALLSGGTPYLYGELALEVRRAMTWIRAEREKAGALGEDRIALVARADMATAILLYALLEIGAPAMLLHPRLAEAERAAIIAAAPSAFFIEDCARARSAWQACALDGRAAGLVPDDERCAFLLFTSGTSGRPRGVLMSRSALVAAATASAANLGWHSDDRWFLCMPLAHVGGLSILLRCLHGRRTVVFGPDGTFEPLVIAAALLRDSVTLLSLVPTMLHRVLSELPAWVPPPSLRALLLGGAPASAALLCQAARRAVPVLCTYGLTEASAQVATQRPGTSAALHQGCGPPLPGVELRIEQGEIQLRGPTLLSGYYGQLKSPFIDGDWFPTGDLGRLDEKGCLHLLGRSDDLIISGGENIQPEEVEAALCEIPGVLASCVFGDADNLWGQVVAAAVVADRPLYDVDLVAYLAPRLAAYKLPRRIAYLANLPLTAAGKLDRGAAVRAAAPRLRPLARSR